ncbi:MAG: twin-arginine translocation pathway signal protein [Pseudomonadota bacterium]
MKISRRNAISLIGGGAVLAATAATAGFVTTRTPNSALKPWKTAGSYSEPRKFALSYAILAPNPHNRQPWIVDLREDGKVILLRDEQRDLPMTDPHNRQIVIGLGCFLELMKIAAAQRGFAVDHDLFPQGESGPVSVSTFRAGAQPDPLFAEVMKRRSCKEAFEDRPVPAGLANDLADFATIIDQPEPVAALRKLTWDAWMVEAMTPHTMRESVDLMRFGKAEINANPDGIDLGGPFLEALMLAGQLTREDQLNPSSNGFRQGVEIYRDMLAATPAYAVVTSAANTRADQIDAGRRWLRLNLMTTRLGLALHPVSQALQEYPEMAAHYKSAHDMLAQPGHTVQMLGRLGFGPQVQETPRWPLETRITHG